MGINIIMRDAENRHLLVADTGEGPGGGGTPPSPPPPPFLDQTEARRTEKMFFEIRPPSYLSV